MNRHETFSGGTEAVLEYLPADIRVIKPGAFVRCAVTGQRIGLEELKYWSAEYQEAYAGPEAVKIKLGLKPRAAGPEGC